MKPINMGPSPISYYILTKEVTPMTEKSKKKKADETEEKAQENKELEEANAKAEEYLNIARRLQADFDNFRKRTEKENEEFRKFATEGMTRDLLTIVDDMDRALSTTDEETELVIGIRGIRQNLMKILEENGLAEIPSEGRFDPNIHEALCTVDGDTDGEIAEVFQKGYRMNDRVIRCSKVKVTKKKEEGE